MVKSDDPERQIWGTWEELLLACAVGRHGTRRWESVATEIRSRIPFPHLVTPQSCRQRYGDLQRRFSAAGAGAGDDDGEDADSPSEVPWLEELRKLRVAELRREVERYDLSIGSLQLKVKKLEEERERSIRESRSGDEKPDRPAEESRPSESTPETVAGERISDKVSGPSCGESTSTGPKKNERKPGKEGRKPAEENGGGKLTVPTDDDDGGEKVSPASRERSCDGSTEGDASSDPASRPQSGESVAESSKREAGGEEQVKEDDEEVGRESSDVQSSASLSRRRQQGRGRGWRKAVVSGGSSSVGDEAEGDAEAEEVSDVNNGQGVVESRPLVAFLEIIRSDKHGSVFDCRLDSQESEEYRRLIRQHVDLEMVQSRIDRIGSGHPYAATEFFRDLLLLCNNALVFYPKDAPEYVAAQRLRELVSKRMGAVLRVPSLSKGEAVPALTLGPKPTDTKPKLELDVPFSLLSKTAASTPLIIACRMRSAISNKATAATSLKEDEVEEEEEERPEPDKKSKDNEDKWQGKRTTKEKPVISGTTRGLRTSKTRSGHGGGGGAAGKKSGVAPATNFKSKTIESAVTTEAPSKTDKKTVGGGATPPAAPSTKKQSAASFLNRMKNSNGSATKPAVTAKSSPAGGSGKGSNPKKGAKSANQKDRSSRQGIAAVGGGGSTKKSEETSGGKRSVGRPPKRSAPPPTPPPSKRAREETEPAAPSRLPTSASRKRGRRR